MNLASSIVGTFLMTHGAHAWGTTGHEVVANVAWDLLTDASQRWVEEVLNVTNADDNNGDDDHQSPLGVVADWADRVRHFLPWSAPLHYIDVRDDLFHEGCHIAPHLNPHCRFEYERDCTNNTCVAGAIVNYTSQLLKQEEDDPTLISKLRGKRVHRENGGTANSQKISQSKEALMFLTHFIGDIHQPLHCSRTTDKGGNNFHVHFNLAPSIADDREGISSHHGWNLHSVWDTGLIDVSLSRNYNHSRKALQDDLIADAASVKINYLECDDVLGANLSCTIQWGQESWDSAIRFAYTLDDNKTDVSDGATLDESYYDSRWPIAKERLLAGAIRLAGTVEWIVKNRNEDDKEKSDQLSPASNFPFSPNLWMSWSNWFLSLE